MRHRHHEHGVWETAITDHGRLDRPGQRTADLDRRQEVVVVGVALFVGRPGQREPVAGGHDLPGRQPPGVEFSGFAVEGLRSERDGEGDGNRRLVLHFHHRHRPAVDQCGVHGLDDVARRHPDRGFDDRSAAAKSLAYRRFPGREMPAVVGSDPPVERPAGVRALNQASAVDEEARRRIEHGDEADAAVGDTLGRPGAKPGNQVGQLSPGTACSWPSRPRSSASWAKSASRPR